MPNDESAVVVDFTVKLSVFIFCELEELCTKVRKIPAGYIKCWQKEMKLTGPDRYQLTITDGSVSVTAPNGTPHFVAPATNRGDQKLYVVSKGGALLYVGVTRQPMSVRLRGGLTADGNHGYHGYSWGKKNHTICLDIWYVNGDDVTPIDLEAIEAEVVFHYRQESDQWPSEQTEIHFRQSNSTHREFAKRVLEALTKE